MAQAVQTTDKDKSKPKSMETDRHSQSQQAAPDFLNRSGGMLKGSQELTPPSDSSGRNNDDDKTKIA